MTLYEVYEEVDTHSSDVLTDEKTSTLADSIKSALPHGDNGELDYEACGSLLADSIFGVFDANTKGVFANKDEATSFLFRFLKAYFGSKVAQNNNPMIAGLIKGLSMKAVMRPELFAFVSKFMGV